MILRRINYEILEVKGILMKMAIKTATLLSVRIGACSHLTEMNGSMTVFSRNCENYAEIHVFFFQWRGELNKLNFHLLVMIISTFTHLSL